MLARIPVPRGVRGGVLGFFARALHINTEEASKPLTEYGSVAELFTRDLKPSARPLGAGFVSAVDGTLRGISEVQSVIAEQIKGKTYSLIELLGSEESASKYIGGRLLSLYLAPPNYHHVHAPCDAEISGFTYLPGNLWPVNDWALTRISNLFSRNERIVIDLETQYGKVALVMVGAANVGKMSLTFDPLITNGSRKERLERRYEKRVPIKKGERLGTFHLGSTVVLLLDSECSKKLQFSRPPGGLQYGETLATEAPR